MQQPVVWLVEDPKPVSPIRPSMLPAEGFAVKGVLARFTGCWRRGGDPGARHFWMLGCRTSAALNSAASCGAAWLLFLTARTMKWIHGNCVAPFLPEVCAR